MMFSSSRLRIPFWVLLSAACYSSFSDASSSCRKTFAATTINRPAHLSERADARLQKWGVLSATMTFKEWFEDTQRNTHSLHMQETFSRLNADQLAPHFEFEGSKALIPIDGGVELSPHDVLRAWSRDPLFTVIPLGGRMVAEQRVRQATIDLLLEMQRFGSTTESSLEESLNSGHPVATWRRELKKWWMNSGLSALYQRSGMTVARDLTIAEINPGANEYDRVVYESHLDDSIEVIYVVRGVYGHTSLRVGRKWFSFDDVSSARILDYQPTYGRPHKLGVIFSVGQSEVQRLMPVLEQMYMSAHSYNVPPYELFSGPLRIQLGDEQKFRSFSKTLGNRKPAVAGVVPDGRGGRILRSPLWDLPIIQDGAEFFAPSFSCSTIITYVLREFLHVPVADARPIGLMQSFLVEQVRDPRISHINWF
jgi:hypothetical protein